MREDLKDLRQSNKFIQQQKELFQYYIDNNLLKGYRTIGGYNIMKNGIEYILQTKCDQRCEYCYIAQRGDELYPEHASEKTILTNLNLFLDYIYKQNHSYTYFFELFGGDLFSTNLFFKVLNLLDKYFKEIKQSAEEVFFNETILIVPNNMKWVVRQPELVEQVLEKIEYFHNEYNVTISFSWSTDGLYCTNTREKEELTQEYFDKIFNFIIQTQGGYHPMVSASNIENWIQNYDWWIEMLKQDPKQEYEPMMLEVRNDDWTPEKIQKYLDFLKHIFDKRLEMCGGNIDNLAYSMFIGDGKKENTLPAATNYDIIDIREVSSLAGKSEKTSCSLQSTVMFNCNNLSISLCHRTSYILFTPCFFIADEDNEHIVDFIPHNLDAYIGIRDLKDSNQPQCVDCLFNTVCIKGCFGSQFENAGDILMHCQTVCDLFKAKFAFLINLYNDTGLIASAIKNKYINYENRSHVKLIELSQCQNYHYNEKGERLNDDGKPADSENVIEAQSELRPEESQELSNNI